MLILKEGIQLKDYKITKFIGEGATSEVWRAQKNNETFALKIFSPKCELDTYSKNLLKKEYDKTKDLNHPNIVSPKDYFEVNETPVIVMEEYNKSLWTIFKNKQKAKQQNSENEKLLFTEKELAKILHDISNALSYLHYKGFVHHDVKPGNILSFQNNGKTSFALSDFGITAEIRQTIIRQTRKHNSLTLAYASPERLRGEQSNAPKNDLFSLGCSLYELTNDIKIAPGTILNNNGAIAPIHGPYSDTYKSLIIRLMSKSPNNRLSAVETRVACQSFLDSGAWNPLNSNQNKPVIDIAPKLSPDRSTVRYADIQANKNISSNLPTEKNRKQILVTLLTFATLTIGYLVYANSTIDNSFLEEYDNYMEWDSFYIVEESGNCGIIDLKNNVILPIKYKLCKVNDTNKTIDLTDHENKKIILPQNKIKQ